MIKYRIRSHVSTVVLLNRWLFFYEPVHRPTVLAQFREVRSSHYRWTKERSPKYYVLSSTLLGYKLDLLRQHQTRRKYFEMYSIYSLTKINKGNKWLARLTFLFNFDSNSLILVGNGLSSSLWELLWATISSRSFTEKQLLHKGSLGFMIMECVGLRD